MLSDVEKVNVVDLLSTIPPEDLLDVARTTTSGIISAENQHDAVQIIIQHAEDVRSLLARKKITKTILFKYLHNKRVPFAAAIDKATLIDATIAYWQNGGPNGTGVQPGTISVPQPNQNICNELALKFCEWFFAKLNEPLAMTGDDRLDQVDFWQDATAGITLKSGEELVQHAASGSGEVVALLSSLQEQHRLYFSPNLSQDGMRAKAEAHGLVVVFVCGTLHRGQGQCVGLFEQKFGLIKDPYASDNWKIKTLDLNLHSKPGVTSQPVLPAELLAIDQ